MVGSKGNEDNKASMAGNIHHFTSELQQFDFTEEAIDVALRKLLAKVHLPKESQHIDQAMEDFAKRYHHCNSTLVDSYDPIYAMAFSILLLHTDAHNKNVKRKMTKDTFIKRTQLIEGGETVYSEVLDVMYDNIIYSEFSYAHDQQDKSSSWFTKKSGQPNIALLHDLYPKLAQLMPATNNFSYKYAPKSTINITNLHQSIEEASSVLLAGVRSRQQHQQHQQLSNGNETFLARVCKAAIVERKYDLVHGGRRSSARGWRPFGMILSGNQIMFFGDLVLFQSWLDSQQQQQQMGSSSNNSTAFPSSSTHSTQSNQHQSPYLSIPTPFKVSTPTSNLESFTTCNSSQALATSTTSNLNLLPSSTTYLTSAGSSTSNNTFMTVSSSATTICLRPMQIVSLSNAICVYDESYRKYPHVFRLITGDGQQFLIRCHSADDMDDWIQKINYVSAIKTTGVRLHPKTTAAIIAIGNHRNNHRVYQHQFHSQQQLLGTDDYQHYPHHDRLATQHWMKREHKAKAVIASLNEQLAEQQQQLAKDEQLRNQLMLLVPMQKATKDRLLLFADSVGKRLLHDRIVLERLECYREIIEWELFYHQSFKNERDKLGHNGHAKRSGKMGSITRKVSAPLPFYSGLLHDGQKYAGVRIPRPSTSLLVSLSGDDGSKNQYGDDLATATTTNGETQGDSEKLEIAITSIRNRRQSCPHLNLLPSNSDHDDHQQQGSVPVEADTTCGNYRDECYCPHHQHRSIKDSTCRLLSRQRRSQSNSFLTTRHTSTGKDDMRGGIGELRFPSLQVPESNKKTHVCSISDVNTDDDGDGDDDIGFVVSRDSETPVGGT